MEHRLASETGGVRQFPEAEKFLKEWTELDYFGQADLVPVFLYLERYSVERYPKPLHADLAKLVTLYIGLKRHLPLANYRNLEVS